MADEGTGRHVLIVNHAGGLTRAHTDVTFDSVAHVLDASQEVVLPNSSTEQTFSAAILPWFWNAKQRGYRTVCLGDMGVSTPSKQSFRMVIPGSSERLSSVGIDVASDVYHGAWDCLSQDLKILEECLSLLSQPRSGSDRPLFVCVNLMSCNDVDCLQLPSLNPHPRSHVTLALAESSEFDPRCVPPVVSSAREYVAVCDYLVDRLRVLMRRVCDVLSCPCLEGSSVAMTATRCLSIGEHGFYGTSPMAHGTQTRFSWRSVGQNAPVHASSRHPVALSCMTEAFIQCCFGDTHGVRVPDPVFPLHTKLARYRRVMTLINGRLYTCVDDRVFDAHADPLETHDVRPNLRHISHLLPATRGEARPVESPHSAPGSGRPTDDTAIRSKMAPPRRTVALMRTRRLGSMTAAPPHVPVTPTLSDMSSFVVNPVATGATGEAVSKQEGGFVDTIEDSLDLATDSSRTPLRARAQSIREREQRLTQQHR